jgi:non-specific protein-tyrosine kinase
LGASPADEKPATSSRPEPKADENLVDKRAVEAYQTLRTWLQFSYGRQPARERFLLSLLITSPRSQRDNGQVAFDLGMALALADLKVVLVDADLREPSLHRLLEDASVETTGGSGLSDLLARGGNWQRHVVATRIPNLSLLPAGSPAADPAHLFSSPAMARTLRQLHKGSDVVLLNAPPVLAAPDALILAAQVEATLLVLENRMPYKWAAQALRMLYEGQVNVLGAILTRAKLRASDPPPHCDLGQLVQSVESPSRYNGMQPQASPWRLVPKSTERPADDALLDGQLGPSQRLPVETALLVPDRQPSATDHGLWADQHSVEKKGGNARVHAAMSARDVLRQRA